MERGPFWRAGLLPEAPWEAHPVTIIANLGEPIGESRVNIHHHKDPDSRVESTFYRPVRSW